MSWPYQSCVYCSLPLIRFKIATKSINEVSQASERVVLGSKRSRFRFKDQLL